MSGHAFQGSKVSLMQEDIQFGKITKLSHPHPQLLLSAFPSHHLGVMGFFRPIVCRRPLQLSSPTITIADCHPARQEFVLEAVVRIMTTICAQPLFLPPPSLFCHCWDRCAMTDLTPPTLTIVFIGISSPATSPPFSSHCLSRPIPPD